MVIKMQSLLVLMEIWEHQAKFCLLMPAVVSLSNSNSWPFSTNLFSVQVGTVWVKALSGSDQLSVQGEGGKEIIDDVAAAGQLKWFMFKS